jgi:hypothetical protein
VLGKVNETGLLNEIKELKQDELKNVRQTLAYVQIYQEDDEEMFITDKMNALRLLDEKNKELSDGSRKGKGHKAAKGAGSINESMKSSLMQSEVRLSIKNTKNIPILV